MALGKCMYCYTQKDLKVCVQPDPHYGYYGKPILSCTRCKPPEYVESEDYDTDLHDHIFYGTEKKDWYRESCFCKHHSAIYCILCHEDMTYDSKEKGNNKVNVKYGILDGKKHRNYRVCERCFKENDGIKIVLRDHEIGIENEYLTFIEKIKELYRNDKQHHVHAPYDPIDENGEYI